MRRVSIVFLMVILVFLFASCIDYSVIEKQETKEVMAQQKEAQEEKDILDKIASLEKENEEQLQKIEKITKQYEDLEKANAKLNEKQQEYKQQAEKNKNDLSYTLALFANSRKLNDYLKDIIIGDGAVGDELTFEFVDLLAVEYSELNGCSITFDRVKTDYLEKGYNPLSTFEIDEESYYDDENYKSGIVKKEKMQVSPNAYMLVDDMESYGFEEEAAKYLKQIVNIPKQEVENFDWYDEDKQPTLDSEGNEIVEKRIYFVGIVNDEIAFMMERGNK